MKRIQMKNRNAVQCIPVPAERDIYIPQVARVTGTPVLPQKNTEIHAAADPALLQETLTAAAGMNRMTSE